MSKAWSDAHNGNFEYVNGDGVTIVMQSVFQDIPHRRDSDVETVGPSLTRQDMSDECDINQIMARYEQTGMLPMSAAGEPVYADFVNMPDLQIAMHMMDQADEAFMRLPASVRKEFDNDAVRFVEFAQNGDNIGKLREWGLAPPEKTPDPPMRVEVVNQAGDNRSPPAPGDAADGAAR